MDNLNLIRKIAWSFHKSTKLEWDDLFQEACYHYIRALKTYDPKKGYYLSTYLWNFISNELILYLNNEQKRTHPSIDDVQIQEVFESTPFWEVLSSDAQEIARIVLDNSSLFVCLTTEEAEEKVSYILLNKGWSEKQIDNGIYDLKNAFNSK